LLIGLQEGGLFWHKLNYLFIFVFNPTVEVIGYSIVKKQVKKFGKIKNYKGGRNL
jgi:hypothetical protein